MFNSFCFLNIIASLASDSFIYQICWTSLQSVTSLFSKQGGRKQFSKTEEKSSVGRGYSHRVPFNCQNSPYGALNIFKMLDLCGALEVKKMHSFSHWYHNRENQDRFSGRKLNKQLVKNIKIENKPGSVVFPFLDNCAGLFTQKPRLFTERKIPATCVWLKF